MNMKATSPPTCHLAPSSPLELDGRDLGDAHFDFPSFHSFRTQDTLLGFSVLLVFSLVWAPVDWNWDWGWQVLLTRTPPSFPSPNTGNFAAGSHKGGI